MYLPFQAIGIILWMVSKLSSVMRPETEVEGIVDAIGGRWSSRAIDASAPITSGVLGRLFEAARWAPSSFNNQPWRFLAFGQENADALEMARKTLVPRNAWALAAPRLIFVLSRIDISGTKRANALAMYETGMAVIQMALQATQEGLVFHQMIGFDSKQFRENFGVSENFAILTAVAVGWPGNPELIPEDLRLMETKTRTRKAIAELVFFNGAVPSK